MLALVALKKANRAKAKVDLDLDQECCALIALVEPIFTW